MVWSCGLAVGMWVAVLVPQVAASLAVLGVGSTIVFPHAQWKAALPWLLAGWGLAQICAQEQQRAGRLPVETPVAEWVLIRPAFLPSHLSMSGASSQGGLWSGIDAQGQHLRIWMKADIHEAHGRWRWAFVQLYCIEASDWSAAFDFGAYLRNANVTSQGTVIAWGGSVALPPVKAGLERLGWTWRQLLARRFARDESGLLLGIFGGDKRAVSREVKGAFQRLGLAHLLAVSGYHVGLVAGLFLILLRSQNRWVKRFSIGGVVLSLGFVIACGTSVSGLRSWVMLSLVWTVVVRGKRPLTWEAFGVAAVLACASEVSLPKQLGTQLSFLATASLLALGNAKRLALRVPWRAQWATSLLTIPTFPSFPLWFYPLNLVAGMVMLVWGVMAGAAVFGMPWAAAILARSVEGVCTWAVALADLPGATISTHGLSGKVGFVLILPFTLRWTMGLLSEDRRSLIWRTLCLACLLHGMYMTCRETQRDHMIWVHLKGNPGAWAVTDGYGWRSWTSSPKDQKARHASRRIGVEGPCDFWHSNGGNKESLAQKKWIPPPMKVWIQRETYNSTSHPVLDAELSSVSASW